VLNAANEVAVASFLEGRIRFDQIHAVNQGTVAAVSFHSPHDLEGLLALDQESRAVARSLVQAMSA
jgi:1-deoxy-D-xylulose-5-phosphate reductoisomerase